LDESEGRLAPGDDGVHAGTVAVVGADPAVAVAVEGGGVAAAPAIAFAGDEIDEGRFLSLLHASLPGTWRGPGRHRRALPALGGPAGRKVCSEVYERPRRMPRGKTFVALPKSARIAGFAAAPRARLGRAASGQGGPLSALSSTWPPTPK